MNRLFIQGISAVFLICMIPVAATAKSAAPDPYASNSPTRIAERVEQHIEVFSEPGDEVREFEIYEPGASFIKLHFSQFRLPPGMELEVSNPSGTESYRYSNSRRDALTFDTRQGDDGKHSFSAMSVSGDTVVLRIMGEVGSKLRATGKANVSKDHRVAVDSMLVGLPEDEIGNVVSDQSSLQAFDDEAISQPQDTCGGLAGDYDYVACYMLSHPQAVERSKAVARVLTANGQTCTAWRVGPDNRLLTDHGCLAGQSNVSANEIWFNWQFAACYDQSINNVVKVSASALLASSEQLDYSLFSVSNFDLITEFGYLGLDVREAVNGENIYITHFSETRPKRLSIESDMNVGGLCQIDSANEHGNVANSDVGYFCDTWYGAYGAPVIASATNRVIALNHIEGCFNQGVKIARIWPEISSYFGGVIPAGDIEDNNQLPEADLGWSCYKMQCSFDASGSTDSDGIIASYHWTTGDGYSTSAESFTHAYSYNGTYTITLTVEDNEGGTSTATSSVTAWGGADPGANQQPTAAFQVSCNDTNCSFDASASSDPDGTIQSYQWAFGDGGSDSQNIPTTNHQYANSGTYSVSLTVLDNDGASGSASSTITVLVSTENVDPTANFTSGCNDLSCNFNGSSSSDSDGTVVSYQWNFGDGGSSTSMAPSHNYSSDGNYNVTLTVYDDAGGNDSMTTTVTVSGVQVPPPNDPPTADFTFSCNDLNCAFDGSVSNDPEGNVMNYQWSFGDGGSGTGMNKSHAFNNGGTYQVTLTVWDDADASDSRSRSVTVSPPANNPPTANFSFSCNDLTCNFDGSNSSDSDGSIASYAWSLGGSSSTSTHTFGSSGTYQVSLTVSDDKGASDSQTRSVQVTAPANNFTLSVSGSKYRGRKEAWLEWSGANGDNVQILRDGVEILATTANDGLHIDKSVAKKTKSARYQVCEVGGSPCSDLVTAKF